MNHKRENRDSVKSVNMCMAVTPTAYTKISELSGILGISMSQFSRDAVLEKIEREERRLKK